MEGLNFEEKQLPFNIEAEKSVLGAVLINPQKIANLQMILEMDDFYKRAHQLIYNAMIRLADNNLVIDIVTLANQLDAFDELENAGGNEYLIDISYATPTSENIDYYAKIVKEKATLRGG